MKKFIKFKDLSDDFHQNSTRAINEIYDLLATMKKLPPDIILNSLAIIFSRIVRDNYKKEAIDFVIDNFASMIKENAKQ